MNDDFDSVEPIPLSDEEQELVKKLTLANKGIVASEAKANKIILGKFEDKASELMKRSLNGSVSNDEAAKEMQNILKELLSYAFYIGADISSLLVVNALEGTNVPLDKARILNIYVDANEVMSLDEDLDVGGILLGSFISAAVIDKAFSNLDSRGCSHHE